jgi:hypothetical protein
VKNYILAHGFGFTDDYWQHLVPFLDGKIYYFDDETIDSHKEYIGIGHSLGFLKLNNSALRFSHLIGLQSFLNFCGHRDGPRKIIESKLKEISHNVEIDPVKTMEIFYQACGYFASVPENLSKKTLLSELEMMKENYSHCGVPTMIMGTQGDTIVPPGIIEENFSTISHVTVKILDLKTNHSLGFHHPEIVAHGIESFIQ